MENVTKCNNEDSTGDGGHYFLAIIDMIEIISKINENYGVLSCSICGNDLKWSKAINGHIKGKCLTENCASWMM